MAKKDCQVTSSQGAWVDYSKRGWSMTRITDVIKVSILGGIVLEKKKTLVIDRGKGRHPQPS